MTENEAVEYLQNRYLVVGSLANPPQEECEKHNAVVEVAIKALEEIQQYREIEREIKEHYQANVDIKMIMKCFIETIFKGEPHEHFYVLTNEDADKWDE